MLWYDFPLLTLVTAVFCAVRGDSEVVPILWASRGAGTFCQNELGVRQIYSGSEAVRDCPGRLVNDLSKTKHFKHIEVCASLSQASPLLPRATYITQLPMLTN